MAKVEIYKLQNDGSQKVLCVCTLIDNTAQCAGDPIFTENLTQRGIQNYSKQGPQTLFPKDGRVFLEQLRYNYTSGYLNASEIIEN